MKQRTHAWIAVRAIALLEDAGTDDGLVALLKPHVAATAIGSWLPDLRDAKVGTGAIDNHVFKMEPYEGEETWRFTLKRDDLFDKLGEHRLVRAFIDAHGEGLDEGWWSAPYKADPKPGQHLANRSMALTTTLVDQLLLGDAAVASLVPGEVSFAKDLDPEARTRREEIATYFSMLSHFVADACQPCHCDARKLAGYSNGVHQELEAHWDKEIGTYFDKTKLQKTTDSAAAVLKRARDIDAAFGLQFDAAIPDLVSGDAWLEVLYLCRASFAVASILASPAEFPYGSDGLTTFDAVFDSGAHPGLIEDLDRAVLHDAVLNVAIVWRDVWRTFP
jgi:hypothetical protein